MSSRIPGRVSEYAKLLLISSLDPCLLLENAIEVLPQCNALFNDSTRKQVLDSPIIVLDSIKHDAELLLVNGKNNHIHRYDRNRKIKDSIRILII